MVHMLQFNGKQGEVIAKGAGSAGLPRAMASNLRCPRNGKRTNVTLIKSGLHSVFIMSH